MIMQKENSKYQFIIPQFIIPVCAQSILNKSTIKISRTKKICTLGPQTSTKQMVLKLIDNGANVARLNFSHGTHQGHQKYIYLVKQALKQRPFHHMSILLDTKGPQIRTGNNLNGIDINLIKGQQLQISKYFIINLATDYSVLCNDKIIACSYKDLVKSVKIGSKILFADGKISSVVKKIDIQKSSVFVQILNNGSIGSKKNMCLPGSQVALPTINDYDQNDIINFGVKHKVDFIAVSFARFRKDIQYIRKIIGQKDQVYAQDVQIISKIQNTQALLNIQQIINASNGIMIARGDLGMETPLQKIIILQKLITTKCLNSSKFVIVATQMLQSMQSKPRPTRAQVSDVTNAILDLSDSTMTSGQTANGQFPQQTTKYMNKISIEAQNNCDYKKLFNYRLKKQLNDLQRQAYNLVNTSFQQNVDIIFIRTNNQNLINHISSLRPKAYIFVLSNSLSLKNYTSLNFGVYVFNEQYFENPQKLLIITQKIFGFKSPIKLIVCEWNQVLLKCHQKIGFYLNEK